MDPVVLQEEEEIDNVDIDELCQALRKSTQEIASIYNETYLQFRGMRKKLREEMSTMDRQPLKPKGHIKRWLSRNGLPETPTFHEFFDKVCDVLKQEDRLDVSNRTLTPTKEIAVLFRVKPDEPIHILDLLMKVPDVFH